MAAGRYDNLNAILKLDPQRDNQEIVFRVGAYEYPWLMRKALEFALFRTYAVPSISAILDQSAQFSAYGQKRYDDTALIIAEITENGYDSERGRAAIRQMNKLHRRWNISNEDFLYVLGAFIYMPIRFSERFGWRPPTHHENLASYYFWVEVGRRMNIRDIPPTYEEFDRFFDDYERQYFVYNAASRRVAQATIDIFLGWYPRPLHPLIRELIYAMLDDPLREAFGFPKAHAALRFVAEGVLKLGALVIRDLLPPRQQPFLLTRQPNRTYPQGYQIEEMGPPERERSASD